MVYIKEAHAADSRRPIPNAPDSPKTDKEREVLASDCIKEMKLTIPFLVDDMKDTASTAYSAWPDRMFIVGTDMKIAYRGERGPRGFKPDDAKKALKEILEKKK